MNKCGVSSVYARLKSVSRVANSPRVFGTYYITGAHIVYVSARPPSSLCRRPKRAYTVGGVFVHEQCAKIEEKNEK